MSTLWIAIVAGTAAAVAGLILGLFKNISPTTKSYISVFIIVSSITLANTLPNPLLSREERGIEKLSKQLELIPEFEARFKNVSGDEARKKGFELSSAGITKLDDASQVRLLAILNSLINTVDEKTCSLLTKGGVGQIDSFDIFKGLTDEEFNDYLRIINDAVIAELGSARSKPPLDQELVDSVFKKVADKIGEKDSLRFGEISANINNATDQDACWMGKQLLSAIQKLDDNDKKIMAKIFFPPIDITSSDVTDSVQIVCNFGNKETIDAKNSAITFSEGDFDLNGKFIGYEKNGAIQKICGITEEDANKNLDLYTYTSPEDQIAKEKLQYKLFDVNLSR